MSNKDFRFQCLVKPETKFFLCAVQPTHGFLSHAINAFLTALVNDCKTNGIESTYSPENCAKLDQFVRERTSPRVTPNERDGHVRRPVERIRNAHKNAKNKSTKLHEGAKGRDGSGGTTEG